MSRFVLAFLIFIAISFGVGQYAGSLVDKYDYPVHSWSWWSVRAVREAVGQRTSIPNTVLLGSSLMVVAMAEGDATWSGKRLDLTTYRKARYLDSLLSESFPRGETINLASPGQVVSDAYLTLKEALSEGLKPELVVYGIAPRDFVDSTMDTPVDTECYRYLSRLVSSQELEPFLNQDVVSSIARRASKAVPLSDRAIDLQLKFSQAASEWSDRALRNGLASKSMPLEKRMRLLSTYEPLDMVPGFIHAEVAQQADVGRLYQDNSADYVARYRKPKPEFYEGQLQCLSKLADLCARNSIELIVVNMPIERRNMSLLPTGRYVKYIHDISKIALSKGVTFRDLCQFDGYCREDYRDTVHLNGFGGMKFTRQLANVICETRRKFLQAANVPRENP